MSQKFTLAMKRLRKLMPRLYHGRACGVSYSTRAVGFWRRYPFRFLPYLTGDVIRLHFKLKREHDWWPEAILRIDPPIVSAMSNMPGGWSSEPIVLSNWAFIIKDVEPGKMWSDTLLLKGGVSFAQPCQIQCYIDLQKVNGDRVVRGTLHIADIEVVPRGPFVTNLFMWGFTTILAIAAIILYIVY